MEARGFGLGDDMMSPAIQRIKTIVRSLRRDT
jgi:hypothetical protein